MFVGIRNSGMSMNIIRPERTVAETACVVVDNLVNATFHGEAELMRWMARPLIAASGEADAVTNRISGVFPLFRQEGDECIVTPIGLYRYLVARLRQRGVTVVVANNDTPLLPLLPDGRTIESMVEEDRVGLTERGPFFHTQVEVLDDGDLIRRLAAISGAHCCVSFRQS